MRLRVLWACSHASENPKPKTLNHKQEKCEALSRKNVDPGEYGVESWNCRLLCCFVFAGASQLRSSGSGARKVYVSYNLNPLRGLHRELF